MARIPRQWPDLAGGGLGRLVASRPPADRFAAANGASNRKIRIGRIGPDIRGIERATARDWNSES